MIKSCIPQVNSLRDCPAIDLLPYLLLFLQVCGPATCLLAGRNPEDGLLAGFFNYKNGSNSNE